MKSHPTKVLKSPRMGSGVHNCQAAIEIQATANTGRRARLILSLTLWILMGGSTKAEEQLQGPVPVPFSEIEEQLRSLVNLKICVLKQKEGPYVRESWYPPNISELFPLKDLEFDDGTIDLHLVYCEQDTKNPTSMNACFLGLLILEKSGVKVVHFFDFRSSPEDFIKRVRAARIAKAEQIVAGQPATRSESK